MQIQPPKAMPEPVEGRALKRMIMKGYMYILLCNDGSYYIGSTNDLERRMTEHFSGQGANHTKKHPPVKLLYYEEFQRIDEAFYREKQVQGWSRKKKEALINGQYEKLPELSKCYSQKEADAGASVGSVTVASTGSATEETGSATEETGSATEETATTTTTAMPERNEAMPELVEGRADSGHFDKLNDHRLKAERKSQKKKCNFA